MGKLPSWCFEGARISLNLAARLIDLCLSTSFSRYGWALAFGPEEHPSMKESASVNVCMRCGSGLDEEPRERVLRLLYRCPYCSSLNLLFPSALLGR
jgi:DNA-directed RNA polymerase subunit RPC12/RpoP